MMRERGAWCFELEKGGRETRDSSKRKEILNEKKTGRKKSSGLEIGWCFRRSPNLG
jgi:hypothetical protein